MDCFEAKPIDVLKDRIRFLESRREETIEGVKHHKKGLENSMASVEKCNQKIEELEKVVQVLGDPDFKASKINLEDIA